MMTMLMMKNWLRGLWLLRLAYSAPGGVQRLVDQPTPGDAVSAWTSDQRLLMLAAPGSAYSAPGGAQRLVK